jgi:methionine aminopeptidase
MDNVSGMSIETEEELERLRRAAAHVEHTIVVTGEKPLVLTA